MLTIWLLGEAGLPPAVSWILAVLAIVGTLAAAYLIVTSQRTKLVIQQQSVTVDNLTSTVTSQEAEIRMVKDQNTALRLRGDDQAQTITQQNAQIDHWKDVVTQKDAIASLREETSTFHEETRAFHTAILEALNTAREQTATTQTAILQAVTALTVEVSALKSSQPAQSEIGTGSARVAREGGRND